MKPTRIPKIAMAWYFACLLLFFGGSVQGTDDDLTKSFVAEIQPLLTKLCADCHGQVPKDNDLDLTRFDSAQSILAKPKILGDVAERLRLGDMPPKEAKHPSQVERCLLDTSPSPRD